ncbi:MAG: hypothetical protein IT379_18160 [Deltaproteobacteria bacterium]|nr:hypothetical protein [Deltaproteobacteria bacterium]
MRTVARLGLAPWRHLASPALTLLVLACAAGPQPVQAQDVREIPRDEPNVRPAPPPPSAPPSARPARPTRPRPRRPPPRRRRPAAAPVRPSPPASPTPPPTPPSAPQSPAVRTDGDAGDTADDDDDGAEGDSADDDAADTSGDADSDASDDDGDAAEDADSDGWSDEPARSSSRRVPRRSRSAGGDPDDEDGGGDDGDDDEDDDDGDASDDDGEEVTVMITSTAIGEVRTRGQGEAEEAFGIGLFILDAVAGIEDFEVGVRADARGFLSAPDGLGYTNDVRPERLWFSYRHRRFEVTAGDVHVRFGQGLALALEHLDELDLDTTLRGGRIDVHAPDRLRSTLVAGVTNVVNFDQATARALEDPNDLVVGGRVAAELGGDVALGGHVVYYRAPSSVVAPLARSGGADPEVIDPDDTVVLGADVEWAARGPGTSIALEVDVQLRRRVGEDDRGIGAYGRIAQPIGRTSLQLELKQYSAYLPLTSFPDPVTGLVVRYDRAPTAERDDVPLLANSDVTGGRVRFDAPLPVDSAYQSDLFIGVSGAYDRELSVWSIHADGGFAFRWPGRGSLRLEGGYRREVLVETGELERAILHADVEARIPVRRTDEVRVTGQHESLAQAVATGQRATHRGTVAGEYDWRGRLAVGGGVEYDTGARQVRPELYGFITGRWDIVRQVWLRTVLGTRRGGLRCSAGVCRDIPPFQGGRLEVGVRF